MYLHKISGNGILKSNYMKQQILSAEGSVFPQHEVCDDVLEYDRTAAPHSLSLNHKGEFSSLWLQESRAILEIYARLWWVLGPLT